MGFSEAEMRKIEQDRYGHSRVRTQDKGTCASWLMAHYCELEKGHPGFHLSTCTYCEKQEWKDVTVTQTSKAVFHRMKNGDAILWPGITFYAERDLRCPVTDGKGHQCLNSEGHADVEGHTFVDLDE